MSDKWLDVLVGWGKWPFFAGLIGLAFYKMVLPFLLDYLKKKSELGDRQLLALREQLDRSEAARMETQKEFNAALRQQIEATERVAERQILATERIVERQTVTMAALLGEMKALTKEIEARL